MTSVREIGASSVCTAFEKMTIGTKVTHRNSFLAMLATKIDKTDFGNLGQAYINLPEALPFVSGSLARRAEVRDAHVRVHRGHFGAYAPRALAERPDKLGVVVYTIDAYLRDPEVDAEEVQNMLWGEIKFVIVAVLATPAGAGGNGVMGTYRFTSNLAGGNNRCKPENGYSLDLAIKEAKMCLEYETTWMTVAD